MGRLHRVMLVRGDDDILNSSVIPISISRGASVWWSSGQDCIFVYEIGSHCMGRCD